MPLEEQLGKAVKEAYLSDNPRIQMDTVTNFEWDHLYVFPPYTSMESIQSVPGFQWIGLHEYKTGIEMSDSINLLVFIKGGRVVDYIDFPRGQGDFAEVSKSDGFTPKEAVFDIEKTDGLLTLKRSKSDVPELNLLLEAW